MNSPHSRTFWRIAAHDHALPSAGMSGSRAGASLPRMQNQTVVLIGVGEMGGVFAKAVLRAGRTVVPINRGEATVESVSSAPPELVLVTVGEADLHPVLEGLPANWKSRVGLIQNELLPRDWERHGIADPTVAVAWFEKKPGQDVKVVVPTPVSGPSAGLISDALSGIGIDAGVVSAADLPIELVIKNCYILTVNIAGLRVGGTVGELWDDHHDLTAAVADEVLAIQEHLLGNPFDRAAAVDGMARAIAGDPEHKATGRSAPARLERAVNQAAAAGISVPTLAAIQHETMETA